MKLVKFNDSAISPSKIVCVGRNYADHIEELNNEVPAEPVIFIKPNSSISQDIYLDDSDEVHYEGEICFLVESGTLTGIGIGLDLTKRKVQSELKSKGLPWERAKAFDNSAVFSQFVKFDGDFSSLSMKLFINDNLTQFANIDLMLYKPNDLLKDIQSFLSLEDGDILMCGTPRGVGEVKPDSTFHAQLIQQEHVMLEATWVAKESKRED